MKLIEEKILLTSMMKNGNIFLKVFPFLYEDLFSEKWSKIVFQMIKKHYEKYNTVIDGHALELKIDQIKKINESVYNQLIDFYDYFKDFDSVDEEFIIDEIEAWIRSRKYYNALMSSAEKYENNELDGNLSEQINQALAFSFDTNVGLDFENIEEKWNRYTDVKKKIPFNLSSFNSRTNEGANVKTLNVLVSSESGAGKTLTMCHLAVDYLRLGYNVLYITMEIAEDEITARIDSNILDIELNRLNKVRKEEYIRAFEENRVRGRLYVKEYGTGIPHVGHFRYLIKDLKLKQNFKPDVIFIDYLNITNSQGKYKPGDSYGKLKNVSEELRALAKELDDVVIWSATQGNRDSVAKVDMGQDNTSESMAIVHTTDFMVALITTEEYEKQGMLLFSILKNRYSKEKGGAGGKFILKIDKDHMRLSETELQDDYEIKKKEDEAKAYVPKNTIGKQKREAEKKGIDWE